MQGEVEVLGYLNYLEVWNAQRFQEQLKAEPLSAEDLQSLSDMGI